ncbi:MAG: phytoene/squalene synthase family protein [Planctomycetota bacterium]
MTPSLLTTPLALGSKPLRSKRVPTVSEEDATAAPAEVLRRHSVSFWMASRLLPRGRRIDVEKLYAWCRWCDDGVDHAPNPFAARRFVRQALRELRGSARGRPPLSQQTRWFAEVAASRDVHHRAAEALLLGMRMDIAHCRPADEAELLRYCFRAAGVVGVMMCPLLGLTDRALLPNAAALGIGMQMTNIARDVAEDWARGRCYLPTAWTGVLKQDSAPSDHEVRDAVERLLQAADSYYAAGRAGLPGLPIGSRSAVRAAASVYQAIGDQIRRSRFRVMGGRTVVPKLKKVQLVLGLSGSGRRRIASNHVDDALHSCDQLLAEHGISL